MTNLTLSLDDTIVRNARIKAIQKGTSVSAKVREFLRAYVEGADASQTQARQVATGRLMQLIADACHASQASPIHAPDAQTATEGDTLRSSLYADGFRKVACDTARAASAAPLHLAASKPEMQS